METKPTRRWFRFSLRTVFVLLTALCVWLGWTMSVIRERRTVLEDLRASRGFDVVTLAQRQKEYGPNSSYFQRPGISPVRTWLGDQAIESIWFPEARDPDEYEKRYLNRVFPEAELHRSPYPLIEDAGPPPPP